MVFRWFRQNKATTRWLYIVVTIFVMVTFTVTGAMIQGLQAPDGAEVAGEFTLPSGEKVRVTGTEFGRMRQLMARVGRNDPDEEDVWEFLMLDALADEAGIRVSDDMLASALRSVGFQSNEAYQEFLRSRRLSPFDFQDFLRRELRTGIYRQLAAEDPRVLSESIYDRFRSEHELFRVRAVAFPEKEYAAAVAAEEVTDETLRAFYADEIDPKVKEERFSHPARFALDVAVLPVADADAAALAERLPEDQRTVQEAEVASYYRRFQERYRKPEPAPAQPEGDAAEEEADDADDAAEEDPYRPLEEVRGELEAEILVGRVIAATSRAFFDLKSERDAARQHEEDEATDDGTDAESAEETEPAAAAAPAPTDRELFVQAAERFGLEVVDLGEARPADELAGTERLPGEDLKRRLRTMQPGDAAPFFPTTENPYGVLVFLEEEIASEPKPFEEVRDELPEVWREHEARARARREAQAFRDALAAAAREKAAEEIAAVEAEARATAEQRIEAEGVTDEERREEIVRQELDAVKPRIDALVAGHEGEVFDEVAAARGLAVLEVGPFRKSYRTTAFWRDDPASPEKFLKGYAPLFVLPVGGVLGPVQDPETRTQLVATVVERRDPSWDEMQLRDRMEAESALQNQLLMERFQQGRHPFMQFSFETLASRLDLRRAAPPEGEAAARS